MKAVYLGSEPMDIPIKEDVVVIPSEELPKFEKWLEIHDKQIKAEVIEFISDKLIYPLLDECDRGLWEHINHIELAEEWIKVLDDNPYPKVKNHNEARKRDLRQWIAEWIKEQKNGSNEN